MRRTHPWLGAAFIGGALGLSSPAAHAGAPAGKVFGLGIGGGLAVTGLSGKYMLRDDAALQGVVGVLHAGRDDDSLAVSVDFLYEMPDLFTEDGVALAWNAGFGALVGVYENEFGDGGGVKAGISGVVGLELVIDPVPLDLVLEYRPHVILVPSTDIELIEFTAHIRFWFSGNSGISSTPG